MCFVNKPSLTIDHPARENLIENTSTTVCCQGNSNPPTDEIKWKGNGKYLVVNNTTTCLTFSPIHRTNTQRYTCFASNIIGISESHIHIKVLCKLSLTTFVQFEKKSTSISRCLQFIWFDYRILSFEIKLIHRTVYTAVVKILPRTKISFFFPVIKFLT